MDGACKMRGELEKDNRSAGDMCGSHSCGLRMQIC